MDEYEEKIALYSQDENLCKTIFDLANKLMTISDIATITDIEEDVLIIAIRNGDNELSKNYRKGKAERIKFMHEQEIELAAAGSNQGVENLHAYLNQMNSEDS